MRGAGCGRRGHRRRGLWRYTGGGGTVRGGLPGARAGRPPEGRGAAGEPGRTAGKRRGDESVAGRVTRLGETKPAVEARPRIAIRIVNAIRDESGSGPGGGPSASGSCPLTGTDPADDSVRPGHWRIRLAPAVRNAAFRPPAPGGAAFGSPSGAGCDAQPARAPRSAAFGSVRPCGVRRPARPGRGRRDTGRGLPGPAEGARTPAPRPRPRPGRRRPRAVDRKPRRG